MHAQETAASAVKQSDLEAQTVLIVDDDQDIISGLAELIEDEGYAVATATDGQGALDQLRGGLRPCAILLDLMMPRMNGWDFRAEQLKDPDLREIPVIVITAAAVTDASLRAQMGDIAFVRKPPAPDELLRAVRDCCLEPSH
jgi:CheY-like chemotaxis protein